MNALPLDDCPALHSADGGRPRILFGDFFGGIFDGLHLVVFFAFH